jgi:hypothetical protein
VPKSRSGSCGEEKSLMPLPEIEPPFLGHPVRSPSLYTIPTELSRLQYFPFPLLESGTIAVPDSGVLIYRGG